MRGTGTEDERQKERQETRVVSWKAATLDFSDRCYYDRMRRSLARAGTEDGYKAVSYAKTPDRFTSHRDRSVFESPRVFLSGRTIGSKQLRIREKVRKVLLGDHRSMNEG